jgi:hypothetical protein
VPSILHHRSPRMSLLLESPQSTKTKAPSRL